MRSERVYLVNGMVQTPHPAGAINRAPTHCPSLRSDSLMCPVYLVNIHYRPLQVCHPRLWCPAYFVNVHNRPLLACFLDGVIERPMGQGLGEFFAVFCAGMDISWWVEFIRDVA